MGFMGVFCSSVPFFVTAIGSLRKMEAPSRIAFTRWKSREGSFPAGGRPDSPPKAWLPDPMQNFLSLPLAFWREICKK